MCGSAADKELLVVDAPVTVPESHSLFSDAPVLVVMNYLKLLLSVAGDELYLVLFAYSTV